MVGKRGPCPGNLVPVGAGAQNRKGLGEEETFMLTGEPRPPSAHEVLVVTLWA